MADNQLPADITVPLDDVDQARKQIKQVHQEMADDDKSDSIKSDNTNKHNEHKGGNQPVAPLKKIAPIVADKSEKLNDKIQSTANKVARKEKANPKFKGYLILMPYFIIILILAVVILLIIKR